MLDKIPYDVLQFRLEPFLDYESMVNFNRVVNPRDRISHPFIKNFVIIHHHNVVMKKLKSIMDRIETTTGKERIPILYKLLKELQNPLNSIIIQQHERFRQIYRTKFLEFMNPMSQEYQVDFMTIKWKLSLIKISIKGLEYLEQTPYCPINLDKEKPRLPSWYLY